MKFEAKTTILDTDRNVKRMQNGHKQTAKNDTNKTTTLVQAEIQTITYDMDMWVT